MTFRPGAVDGAIHGHLVGDALLVPYEFTHHIESVEWRGHGSHHQPAGTWSDDGALMLALLDSLLDVGFDSDHQASRFLAWRNHGAYTPGGEGGFDIGPATDRALSRVAARAPVEEAGNDPEALGNGSLMRILPIALVDPSATTAALVEQAHRSSRITHGAPAVRSPAPSTCSSRTSCSPAIRTELRRLTARSTCSDGVCRYPATSHLPMH